VFLTNDGRIYSYGANGSGQLGVGDHEKRYTPTLIKFSNVAHADVFVKSVACGGHHCLALMSDGSVYSWGSNTYSQLGIEKRLDPLNLASYFSSANSPTLIVLLNQKSVTHLYCCRYSSYVMTTTELISFGKKSLETTRIRY